VSELGKFSNLCSCGHTTVTRSSMPLERIEFHCMYCHVITPLKMHRNLKNELAAAKKEIALLKAI